ncbi:MAG: hypothetical protein OEZ38_11520 [Gammaproteobacteria bacterium]|nr:hypothetical protein [Gammaproteobacteria bacterium]
MKIPYIYIYFALEFSALLIAFVIYLLFINRKKLKLIEKLKEIIKKLKSTQQVKDETTQTSQYTDYLKQEIDRNSGKIKTLKSSLENPEGTTTDKNEDDNVDEQSNNRILLLTIRDELLNSEISSNEHNEDENRFWSSLYKNLQDISDKHLKRIEETVIKEEIHVNKIIKKSNDTILQIEPQGKKIDTEVNKLKDILYDQENSISALTKALKKASDDHPDPETKSTLKALHSQVSELETNLNESRTCLEILEAENERLQSELAETKNHKDSMRDPPTIEPASTTQELQENINELELTIETLKIEADQAEELHKVINNFTQNSHEMMGCIAVLEDKNKQLSNEIKLLKNGSSSENTEQTNNIDSVLQQKINELEEALIKKDVDYARLQEDFLSMEKEYLNMYEAMQNPE